jgi:propanol-preferring alcohol dehydrogenase
MVLFAGLLFGTFGLPPTTSVQDGPGAHEEMRMVLSRDLQRRAQMAAGAVGSLEDVPMRVWVVDTPGPVDGGPLIRIQLPTAMPGPGQILVRVSCCGVCRTDLHLVEGDLPPHRRRTVPGYEVVGVVDAVGPGSHRFRVGDRVGVPWLARTDGSCAYCRRGDENLCTAPQFTGWDVDGGYADACVADEAYVYRLPESLDDEHAAPLLCAGIIGYRALRRSRVPPGGRLGIYGFGGSAHLTAQVALHLGMRVHVLTRGERNQDLARRLGADSVGAADGTPPEPLDGAVLFAPAGELVPTAMRALDRGGTLAVAGIWLSDIPTLGYDDTLFQERTLSSVTANTRKDGEEFLALAERCDSSGHRQLSHGGRPTRPVGPDPRPLQRRRCALCGLRPRVGPKVPGPALAWAKAWAHERDNTTTGHRHTAPWTV